MEKSKYKDALSAFTPRTFGKKEETVDRSKRYETTRRQNTVTIVKKRKRELSEEERKQQDSNQVSISDAAKAVADYEAGPANALGYIVVGPERPTGAVEVEEEYEEEVRVDGEEEGNDPRFPLSNEIKLRGHTRTVTALAVDRSGARVITGSSDYSVKLWDFAGMDSSHRSFRSMEPCAGHQITAVSWSVTGDQVLVCTGGAKPKIYTRDGQEVSEFVRGDMYLADMANTKGHVSGVTCGEWHPTARNTVMTSALDSTIRIWDINDVTKQKHVLKMKTERGNTRLPVNTCTYSHDGSLIGAACEDGSLWIWPANGPYNRPKQVLRGAHLGEVSRLCFAKDGRTLVSRGNDDTMKVWDLRALKEPVKTMSDLQTIGSSDCIFSPNDEWIVTGTSAKKDEGSGLLKVYDKSSFELVKQIGVAAGSVTRIAWHPNLNQILVACSENVHVYFDPDTSKNGALMSTVRAKRKLDPSDMVQHMAIHNPHALPMFKAEPSAKRKRLKDRKDPIKSRKPDLPTQGPGYGGRIGSNLTHHLMQGLLPEKTERDEDPREAILKFAQQAEADPYWFKAYKDTQPQTKFDYTALQEEQERERRKAEEAAKKKK